MRRAIGCNCLAGAQEGANVPHVGILDLPPSAVGWPLGDPIWIEKDESKEAHHGTVPRYVPYRR